MPDYILQQIDELTGLSATPWAGLIPLSNAGVTRSLSLGILRQDMLQDAQLTGTPTAPTPNQSDTSERIATCEFVDGKVAALGFLGQASQSAFGTVKLSTPGTPIVYHKDAIDAKVWGLGQGGTGAIDADGARVNLVAAKSGVNNDITQLSALAQLPSIIAAAIAAATPVGSISIYGGSTAPTGFLLCDGAIVLRSAYPALYGQIWTRYGLTFSVPDFRYRFPLGQGLFGISRGLSGGSDLHTLTLAEMPVHSHVAQVVKGYDLTTTNVVGGTVAGSNQYVTKTFAANAIPVEVNNAGSGEPFYQMPPFLGVNFIIKF
jgi:microcystin-dependent protein